MNTYLLTIRQNSFHRQIVVNGEELLRKIISTLPKNYEILEITQNDILQEDGEDFLQELKDLQKPKNMEFGKEMK